MRVLAAAALNPVAPCPGHDGFYCWGTHFEQTQRPRKLGLNNTTQKVSRSNMSGLVSCIGRCLTSTGRLLNSEIVDPLTRAQLRNQPARLLATTGPSL